MQVWLQFRFLRSKDDPTKLTRRHRQCHGLQQVCSGDLG
jgi:hypothetical protein